jgi:molecular chaperone HscB
VICWSCQRAAGEGETCANCGAIQPPDLTADHFRVLGVPTDFALDTKGVEARFRALSRAMHPDRFATADARARRFSMQRTVQLNEAWKTLKDPVRRAEYLLSRQGWEVGAESGASRPGLVAGARERIPVPAALLGEVLELREELSDARAAGDDGRVQALASDVRGRMKAALARVATGFATAEAATDKPSALEGVAHDLIGIRYWRRFLEEVAVHDETEQTRQENAGTSDTIPDDQRGPPGA